MDSGKHHPEGGTNFLTILFYPLVFKLKIQIDKSFYSKKVGDIFDLI